MQASNCQTGSSNYKLMLEQELSSTISKQTDLLSKEFRRFPFLLYKVWLILNFIIYVFFGLSMAISWYKANFIVTLQKSDISITISFICFLYGGGKMLYAIEKKKSRMAQEGFVKFQYDLISSFIGLAILATKEENVDGWLLWAYWCFSPIVHLTGGFIVLRAFKKNHPLARKAHEPEVGDRDEDFEEQNELIALEFTKYDQKLKSWPFFFYKGLLQFTVVFEIFFTLSYTLNLMMCVFWFSKIKHEGLPMDFYLVVGLVVTSLLNAYSCSKMEAAMRTRILKKSKSALFLLKICTVFAINKYLFVATYTYLREKYDGLENLPPQLLWITFFVVAPLVTLIGAFKVHKIIEQRDSFVQVSSYPEDSYL